MIKREGCRGDCLFPPVPPVEDCRFHKDLKTRTNRGCCFGKGCAFRKPPLIDKHTHVCLVAEGSERPGSRQTFCRPCLGKVALCGPDGGVLKEGGWWRRHAGLEQKSSTNFQLLKSQGSHERVLGALCECSSLSRGMGVQRIAGAFRRFGVLRAGVVCGRGFGPFLSLPLALLSFHALPTRG